MSNIVTAFFAARDSAIAAILSGSKVAPFVFNGRRYQAEPDKDRPGSWWTVLV